MSAPFQEHNFFTIDECDKIKEYAYRKEEELIKEGHLQGKFDSITTTNYFRYNFFKDHPIYAERFVDFLTQTNYLLEWPILVQSWVNIYRKGQGIEWHNHVGHMSKSFAANIFIDGPTQPGVTYLRPNGHDLKEYTIENKRGYIHTFPCTSYHKVKPVESERISIGITYHSFECIDKDIIKLYALNSKDVTTVIILDKP